MFVERRAEHLTGLQCEAAGFADKRLLVRAGEHGPDDRMIHHCQARDAVSISPAGSDRQGIRSECEPCDETCEPVAWLVLMEHAGDVGAIQDHPRLIERDSPGHTRANQDVSTADEVGPRRDRRDLKTTGGRLRRGPDGERRHERGSQHDRRPLTGYARATPRVVEWCMHSVSISAEPVTRTDPDVRINRATGAGIDYPP